MGTEAGRGTTVTQGIQSNVEEHDGKLIVRVQTEDEALARRADRRCRTPTDTSAAAQARKGVGLSLTSNDYRPASLQTASHFSAAMRKTR